jgi:hypothetical protein
MAHGICAHKFIDTAIVDTLAYGVCRPAARCDVEKERRAPPAAAGGASSEDPRSGCRREQAHGENLDHAANSTAASARPRSHERRLSGPADLERHQYIPSSRPTILRSSRELRSDIEVMTTSRTSLASHGDPQHSKTPQPLSGYSTHNRRWGLRTNPRHILSATLTLPGHRSSLDHSSRAITARAYGDRPRTTDVRGTGRHRNRRPARTSSGRLRGIVLSDRTHDASLPQSAFAETLNAASIATTR